MRKIVSAVMLGSSLAAIAAAAPSYAQSASGAKKPAASVAIGSKDTQADESETIIVTGTQIRGVTPAGSTLLTQTAAQNEEQGATNANEVLSQIPQAANVFQALPSIGGGFSVTGAGAATRLTFSSITLRNLPNVNTGGGEFTLQLLDGHRIVPVGNDVLGGQGVDASSIPASLLGRTEVMPDGGSAIYGSNAVAGVINYVTRDKFNGVRLQLRGGMAGAYKQGDASITAGKSWSTGDIFATFSAQAHDAMYGYQLDYVRAVDANPNSPLYLKPLGLNCDNPNIAITSSVSGISSRRLYPMTGPGGTIQPYTTNGGTNGSGSAASPNSIAGGNRCDSTDYTSNYPVSRNFAAGMGLHQELSDSLTFSLTGFWSKRKTTNYTQLNLTSSAITSSNPNYRPVCGYGGGPACVDANGFYTTDGTASQVVFTNYGNVLGRSVKATVDLELWQVTPQLAWNFAPEWQARAMLSYGESKTVGINGALDTTVQNSRIASGLINPYNVLASGAGAFDNLITYDYRGGSFRLLDTRVIADGPLPFLKLPAGEIHVALGAEYARTSLHQQSTGTTRSSTPSGFLIANDFHYTQTVKSVFGELQIPLVDDEMNIPLIHALDISASGRYDHYSDFGGTFNKLAGVTWGLTDWIKVRGVYSTSFAAPNLLTEISTAAGAVLSNRDCNGVALFCGATPTPLPYFAGYIPPGGANGGQTGTTSQGAVSQTAPTGIGAVLSSGTAKGIGPQTSRTYSLGIDIEPPIVRGLSFGVSYYDLKINNAIATPLAPATQSVFDLHPELVLCHGGVTGTASNAPAACAVPLSLTELSSAGITVAADPTNPTAPGLATPASLSSTTGPGGAFGTLPWPTILNNYCGPEAFQAHTCAAGTYSVFYVVDGRNRNLGMIFSRGVDFHANYKTDVPWGTVDFNASGTVNLATRTQSPGLAAVDNQATGVSKFRLSASAGTTWGGLRAQVTWQHSGGYAIAATSIGTVGTTTVPGTLNYGQLRVGAFNTFDLFLRYDFDKLGNQNGLFKGLSLTLNVNNFTNATPPIQGGGYANGATLGRMFQLGLSKDF